MKKTKPKKQKARMWWVTIANDVIFDSFGSKRDAVENIKLKQEYVGYDDMKAVKVIEVIK